MSSKEKEPVSRFWACLFATSIFALVWTLKLKTTRKWLLLQIGMPVALLLMMTVPMLLVSDLDQETLAESYLSTASYQIVAALVIVGLLGVEAFTIIYMYRWTTTYNLREFGFRSKKEWKNQSIGDSGP